jgi:hypothetical protein
MNFSNCLKKQTTTVIHKTDVSTSLALISTLDFLLPLTLTAELLKVHLNVNFFFPPNKILCLFLAFRILPHVQPKETVLLLL